ncbi:DUF1837 domain-containing protein [Flavobacterium circumlabens]|uniref:DUF1837 domain-containing protein n=1 Tax=Flavobacterium circumlabens TaxID=2133765 RepID=A0A4Y7U993_9FLAO|nr:DUF1837 domain-containing protein [Flavobacterium circumlabens]TCN54650.1 uncharacterized protein DUF1837 [Flavobacterium circumlabens]TEB42844.1 DUF1837 domain-containing protein [Flavobacterium circumlabens]
MINFEVLINDAFSVITNDLTLNPIDNKRVISLVNTFEDGYWNYSKFQKFIWNNIKETALSYRERQSLSLEGEDSMLTEAAINLRLSENEDDFCRGSEISEILLYGIMKNFYKALPIVPKIFYKQNSQDNAKGADSVHIVVESENEFSLWFGESKFYKSIENARLDTIIDSVKDSLTLRKIKKENKLITNLSDINDFAEISPELRSKIIESLSQERSVDSIKPILNIPILLLHECSITSAATHFTDNYKIEIVNFHKERATEYFKRQINKCNDVDLYSEIKFHIILFPVPEKKPIVDKFIAKAQIYRG